MPETFGARLRRRREERGVALLTIAQQTKIKASLLEGLEGGDLSQWPSSVYRRAFVRAYARAVELDPEVLVQEFLQAHPDPPEVDVLAAMASALGRSDGSPRLATGLRRVVGSALESLARRQRGLVSDERADNHVLSRPATQAQNPPVVTSSAPEPAVDENPSGDATAPLATAALATVAVAAEPPKAPEPDLLAVARLCTEFGRIEYLMDVEPLLKDAAGLLDAKGLIVWLWDPSTAHLLPAVVHGYSDKVVSQLPMVSFDADNPTADAFRAAESRVCGDDSQACRAMVVPLLTPAGCAGVLAIELQRGCEGTQSAVAVATILAAQLAPISSRTLSAVFDSAVELAARGVPQAV